MAALLEVDDWPRMARIGCHSRHVDTHEPSAKESPELRKIDGSLSGAGASGVQGQAPVSNGLPPGSTPGATVASSLSPQVPRKAQTGIIKSVPPRP
jgi:hypothetical protein